MGRQRLKSSRTPRPGGNDLAGGKDRWPAPGRMYLVKAEAAVGLVQPQTAADAINVCACVPLRPGFDGEAVAVSQRPTRAIVTAAQMTLDFVMDGASARCAR
jgi:hypothetical protein